jgi:tetratricopeptide (TPR) repeat protein
MGVLRDFWQVPLLIAGVGGIAAAVWFARAHPPKNDFDAALDQAAELMAKGDLAPAEYILKQVIDLNLAKAPESIMPRFLAMKADLSALEMKGVDAPTKAADLALIDAYDAAKSAGWTLTPEQVVVYSKSLVRTGRQQEAIAVVSAGASAEDAEAFRRQTRRTALEAFLDATKSGAEGAKGRASPEVMLAEIDAFRADPGLSLEEAAWAAARAAEIRIAMGAFELAADKLLIDLSRIEGAEVARHDPTHDPTHDHPGHESDHDSNQDSSHAKSDQGEPDETELRGILAELYGLRAEALRRMSRFNKAREEFEHAASIVRAGTPTAASIDIGLGRTLLELGDDDLAEKAFDRAVLAQHKGDLGHSARLGRAEARSNLGRFADAQVDFAALREAVARGDVTPERVVAMQSLLVEHGRNALVDGRLIEALELAQLAIDLREKGRVIADAYVVAGTAAKAEADRILSGSDAGLEGLSPENRVAVNGLLRRAGDMFVDFSGTPECRQATDNSYVQSLRNAAECYDIAGWHDLALARCELLLKALQPDDPDRGDVYLRIAAMREAEGEYGEAVVNYQSAIDVRREGSDYTARAVVPLARALDAGGRGDEAIASLQRVLAGDYGLKPDAVEYFNALDLLARIQFRRERFTESAELLHEALVRCPDSKRVGELRFRLGEAYIGVARGARIESQTADATAAAKARFAQESKDRFTEARRIFDQAIQALEERGAELDGLARDMLREAHMRRADCAFDIGEFEDAIALYEAVDRKYPEHPASMVALIQIVNACDQLGERTRAETAHRRAQLRLAQLPDESFFGGSGILSRESWELWLRNHPPSRRSVATAPEGVAP